VDEVLQHQSEPVRNFLLQTSILDKLTASLCDAVMAPEDSKGMLDILEHNNLFLIPLDDERKWYRYHNLFAEVLQAHLAESQAGLLPILHSRASTWFEENSLRADAIRHALAANDFESAAGLLELAWPETQDKSIQPLTWLGWVKKLPDELFHTRPVLNVGYAFALLRWGEIKEAESRLVDAESQLESPSQKMIVVDQRQFKSLHATIAIGRAYIAQAIGNIPETVRYANLVLELPEADPFRRSQAAMMLGMTYWASGDLKAAEQTFADFTMRLRTAGNIPDAISTTVVLADMRLALGHIHLAIRTSEQLLQFALDHGDPISPDIADLYRVLGGLYLELGDLEVAEKHLKNSEEVGKKSELPVWRYQWHIDRAQLAQTQGDLDTALTFLDEAERLYIRTPLPDLHPISSMKTRIWIAQDKLVQALEWVSEQGLSAEDKLDYLNEFDHITLSRILIARYRNDRKADTIQAVMRLLDRLYQSAEAGRRMYSMIELRILQALAFDVQGKTMPALETLESALTLAQPEGYIRVFVNEGKPMAEMLLKLFARDVNMELKQYIHKLLTVFEQQTAISSVVTTNGGKSSRTGRTQPLIEPLSGRELDVLRLLRSDLSGPEITRELMVSLSTLRTHTQKIYAKLGVNNRRAAVRRAEELDLF
jgi:LuxR family maltose regulon positive regulatory protein